MTFTLSQYSDPLEGVIFGRVACPADGFTVVTVVEYLGDGDAPTPLATIGNRKVALTHSPKVGNFSLYGGTHLLLPSSLRVFRGVLT